jgi:hypothetical protein
VCARSGYEVKCNRGTLKYDRITCRHKKYCFIHIIIMVTAMQQLNITFHREYIRKCSSEVPEEFHSKVPQEGWKQRRE